MIGTLLTLRFKRKKNRFKRIRLFVCSFVCSFVGWSSDLDPRGTCTLAESRATCEINKKAEFLKVIDLQQKSL
jgi:hypothetical protein